MRAIWNPAKNCYELELSAIETGNILYALSVCRQDTDIKQLRKELSELFNAPVARVGVQHTEAEVKEMNKHIWKDHP